MKLIKPLLAILLTLCVSACANLENYGVIQNRGTDYLKARSIQPLRIPPGMSSSTIRAEYPVSDAAYPNTYREVSLTPPGLNTGK